MPRLALPTLLLLASFSAAALTPRSGWTFVPGGQDLLQSGSWGCVSQVTVNADNSLTLTAGANYITPVNTSGFKLLVNGDFSVLATLSEVSGTGALTLVGTLSTGPNFWNGLERLDVFVTGGSVAFSYWTGNSANAGYQSFKLPAGTGNPVTLEAARIGTQIVVFVNGTQAGQMADPGLFNSGQAYIGFNVYPSSTLNVLALAAAIPTSGPTNATVSSLTLTGLPPIPRTGTALRDRADQRGYLVGAGGVGPSLLSMPADGQIMGREFGILTPGNDMKFAETEPAPGQYSFCAADQLVAFAQANGMKVRGHNFVWQQDLPTWLTSGNYTAAQASGILHDHIFAVAGRYKGKLISWDVVNEAIAYGAPYGPQPSYWLTTLGSGYIDQAFIWARQADPTAKLFYNDTGGEGLGAKSDAVYNLVKGMISRGVPIDGVGLQMHVNLADAPSTADISANIQRLGALGLQVHITEMDVALLLPASAADLAAEATVYQNVVTACQANANCTALLTWGISDADSWIPGFLPGYGEALLYDQQLQPKPAYTAVAAVLGPPATTGPPRAVSVNPTANTGSPQSLTFTFSDPRGWQDLDVVNILINTSLDGRQSCYLAYSRPSNVLYLVNDPGTALLPGLVLNGSGSLNNSQCSVNGAGTSAQGNGNDLTLTLNMTFGAGNNIIYMAARDLEGGNSGWQALGTWGVPGTAATGPAVGGVLPARSSGAGAQTFIFTFTDTNGWQDLGVVNVLINDALNGNQSCYLAYSRPDNVLYLVNDAGNALLAGLALSGSGTVGNSQCTVNGAASSASGSGNTLTLTLALSFPSGYAGNRLIYQAARSNGDVLNSGWQAAGSRTMQ